MALKPVYVLVNNLFFAEKIVKTAKAVAVEVRTFDSSNKLLLAAQQKQPSLVLMDCEGLEKEARARFNLMKPGEEVVVFLDTDVARQTSGFRAEIASAWESVKKYFYGFFK